MSKNPIIIGIDPGYDRVGWAIGQKLNNKWFILEHGCVQTSKNDSLMDRYQQIIEELSTAIEKHKPEEAAIESLFWFRNKTTALHVSEARGLVITLFLQNNIKINEYTPLQIKQSITGYGRADKKAVEKMVRTELNLKGKIIDDTIDALALVICHQTSRKLKNLK